MFKLSRYFSIASLIGIAISMVVLSMFFRDVALQSLLNHQTRANFNLTYSFANSIWSEFDEFVNEAPQYTPGQLKQRPLLAYLFDITRQQMQSMDVVKVKIYHLNGVTVFSTDPDQIGEDKSDDEAFIKAKTGKLASEFTFREKFYGIEGEISDRNLISSYIPVFNEDDGKVKVVFEVYTDVTPLVKNMESAQDKIIFGVFSALAILYLFLSVIVKRADYIIQKQEEERKQAEEKIRYQAYHDSLTGLPNRDSFAEHIEQAVKRAKRFNKQGALMFIDLDRFKLINDSLGHDSGDIILRVTAQRIQQSLRESDMAFRLSGDEFVVILEDLEGVENAAIAARRVLEALEDPIAANEQEVIMHLSIGISNFPDDSQTIDELIRQADAAMYRAKDSVHSKYEFFTHGMNAAASDRLSLEIDLQKSLAKDEFRLYYQTKVDPHSKEVIGIEALIRWQHPVRGILQPDAFIPLLEDTGLINSVGKWVLDTACGQLQNWIAMGLKPVRLSVNISARQFRSESLVGYVKSALENSGLAPKYLELELTESMFVQDSEYAISLMHQLKDLGISLSIDDFGSGYSSLSYLKQFPVDFLKIDRSFISDLNINSKDAAITTAISALAHSLGLGLIAEGVENENQVEFLKQQGCNELQGFLFSKPLPASEVEASLDLLELDEIVNQ